MDDGEQLRKSVVRTGLGSLMSVFGSSVQTLGYSQMSLRDRSWPVNGYSFVML